MADLNVSRHAALGHNLYVVSAGEGVPLLMLPSISVTHANWSLLRPHLDKHLRLIMPDPIGAGRSDKPDKPPYYTAEAQADQMLALLDALNLGEAHVMGAAFGGATALAMAGRARERIKSAVIIEGLFAEKHLPLWVARMRDSLGDPLRGRFAFGAMKQRSVTEGMAKATMREEWPRLADAERKAIIAAYADAEADRTGWVGQLRGAGRDVTPLLAGLDTPILYLLGEQSTAGEFLARGVEFLETLPKARVVRVPRGAHDLHIQQPGKVAELALAFWREIGVPV